jgi:hypothetical protein
LQKFLSQLDKAKKMGLRVERGVSDDKKKSFIELHVTASFV